MKKRFYIRDFTQKTEDNYPFYYTRYSTTGSNWTTAPIHAMAFDTEQEAIWKLEQIVKEENGEYEIVTTYS